MTFRRIFFVVLFVAMFHPATAPADGIGFGELGVSSLLCNSKDAPCINYYGLTIRLGLRTEKHPHFGAFLESGWLVGDNYRSRRIGPNLYRDSFSSIIPLLAGVNYIQPLGGRCNLYAGPVAGLLIGVDYAKEYEPNAYYEDGEWQDRVKEWHSRGHSFWSAGGEAGLMLATDRDGECFLNLSYRFLRATSYKIFDVTTGPGWNQQITLSITSSF
ncbi:MAG: hypothetical protein LBI02_02035 [Opitutaceae bacterium]|jgi:hypothetical protein|nr:hypothetical protein [Opitutaceae bacterium]